MKPPSQRLLYLDWVRGIAAITMLQGHVFHSFLRNDLRTGGPYVMSQFAGGMPPAVFLFLLGVAMPLKYAAGMPVAVKVAGWIHGVLFILFVIALVRVVRAARWPIGRTATIFVGALLPFGPIVLDPRMKRYESEFGAHA